MNFDEYERQGLALYSDFAEAVASILNAAIEQDRSLHLQQVKARAKGLESLRDKLVSRELDHCQPFEDHIKDLAGCRIIFYTNSDITRFSQSGILRANFEFDDVKIHHPRLGSSKATEQFRGDNYTVRLKPERAALPEYVRFAGLRCEIQVQTILNHSWSEMAHDTIYKQPKIEGRFGAKAMASIERRLDKVMREYLVPAGHDFQKIASDFARLKAGKDLFDQQPLQLIRDASDNDSRYDAIVRFVEDVLRLYDDVPSEYSEIVSVLVEAAEKARTTEPVSIETPSGSIPGKTGEQVVAQVVNVLRSYWYAGLEATAEAAIRLYDSSASEDERNLTLSLGQELAKHNLGIWKRHGPAAQYALLEIIKELPVEQRERCQPLIRTMLAEFLSPEVEGSEWTSHETLTISTGSVVASPLLEEIRGRAIAQLKDMLIAAQTDDDRGAVIQALSRATDVPFNRMFGAELALIIEKDALAVVEIFRELSAGWSLEIRQHLEDRLLRLHYAHRVVPAWRGDVPELAKANAALLAEILALRDDLNADPLFVRYKTLVGYDSVYPTAWDRDPFDYEARDAWREAAMDEIVAGITDESADEWLEFITRCAQTPSNDLATFPSFGTFLVKLATAKPGVVSRFLYQLDERLAQFLPGMLRGLVAAGHDEFVIRMIHTWVGQVRYLEHIAYYLRTDEVLDSDLLDLVAMRAIEQGESDAVVTSVGAAAARFARNPDNGLKSIFVRSLDYLAAHGDIRWALRPLASWHNAPIIDALDKDEVPILLAAMLPMPRLEYNLQGLLSTVAATHLAEAVRFLGDRIRREREAETNEDYRALPFTVHSLRDALAPYPAEMVAAARQWYALDGELFRFRGGHFLAQIFPEMPGEFEAELRSLLDQGDRADTKMMLALLANYEGNGNIHSLCKDIVERLEEDDKLRLNVAIALESTGVVGGEFGLVEAYEERKALVAEWLNDPRPKVQRFATEFLHQIDQQIAAEQRRAEEDQALQRRRFE